MSFVIELDSHGPFSPGQTISGKLLCIFIKTEIVQGIKTQIKYNPTGAAVDVKIRGAKAKPKQWEERGKLKYITCSLVGLEQTIFSVAEDYQFTDYSGYKVFLKEEVTLASGHIQPSGTYRFPFSFHLPDFGIPSSFKHEFGRVWYKIEVIVLGRELYNKIFQIVEVSVSVNLNDMDDITMVPITYPIDETVEGRCWWSGCLHDARISMYMTLEKDAFLIGENIQIELYISNRSIFNTESLKIALLSHTEFITDYPKRRKHVVKEEMNKLNYGEIEAESQKTYSFNLKVPRHLGVPCFNKCILMRRWYTLMVTMVIGDCYENIELPVRVQLGHIAVVSPRPIGFSQPQSGGSNTLISNNIIPVGQSIQDDGTDLPTAPPPSYDEAIKTANPRNSSRSRNI